MSGREQKFLEINLVFDTLTIASVIDTIVSIVASLQTFEPCHPLFRYGQWFVSQ